MEEPRSPQQEVRNNRGWGAEGGEPVGGSLFTMGRSEREVALFEAGVGVVAGGISDPAHPESRSDPCWLRWRALTPGLLGLKGLCEIFECPPH